MIGQRTRVYEVLRGKRSLSLNMIRELHAKFGIPGKCADSVRLQKQTLGGNLAACSRGKGEEVLIEGEIPTRKNRRMGHPA